MFGNIYSPDLELTYPRLVSSLNPYLIEMFHPGSRTDPVIVCLLSRAEFLVII